MTAFIYMPDWTIESRSERSGEYRVEGHYHIEPTACTSCGTVGQLYRHGTLKVTMRDAPLWGKPLAVEVDRKRYRCRSCSATFLQPLPDMDAKRHMTRRCVEYIHDQCVKQPYTAIAETLGVDPKTVRLVAQEHFQALHEARRVVAPEYLGIDETHILSRARCIITDVGGRSVIDLLEGRSQSLVQHWLSHLPNKQNVRAVAIDMWRPYLTAVRTMLPQAEVVVDRFHVSQMANLSLDLVRKKVGNAMKTGGRRKLMRGRFLLLKRRRDLSDREFLNLDGWLKNVPQLATAYKLKESFCDLWEISEKAVAMATYQKWRASVPKRMEGPFKPLLTAMGNWEREVFAYWDHPITNGYTEAMNRVLKNITRGGPNHSFEAVRAKMLFKHGTQAPDIRCPVCGGLFEPAELDREVIGAPGERRKERPICQQCNRQFHTPEWLTPK